MSQPAELARPIDGRSLAPQLAEPSGGRDRAVLIEGRDNTARARRGFKVRSYVGVRTRRYAYIEHRRAGFDARADGIAAADRRRQDDRASFTTCAATPSSSPAATAILATRPPGSRSRPARPARALLGPRCVLTSGVPGPSR